MKPHQTLILAGERNASAALTAPLFDGSPADLLAAVEPRTALRRFTVLAGGPAAAMLYIQAEYAPIDPVTIALGPRPPILPVATLPEIEIPIALRNPPAPQRSTDPANTAAPMHSSPAVVTKQYASVQRMLCGPPPPIAHIDTYA